MLVLASQSASDPLEFSTPFYDRDTATSTPFMTSIVAIQIQETGSIAHS
jgi:hypothetical protein